MFASSPHIKPKALTKDTQPDRDTARQHFATAIRGFVGAGRAISTSKFAQAMDVSTSWVKQSRLVDASLPMAGELNMLRMMATLGPDFATEVLRPYGLGVHHLPGNGPSVSWLEAAHHTAQFATLVTGHASDSVFDLTELGQQQRQAAKLKHVIASYSHTIETHLQAGTSIRLGS